MGYTSKAVLILCAAMLLFSLTACKKEGTGERVGKKLDQTAEDIKKKLQ